MLTYGATIPLSTRSLVYLSGLLSAHRAEIGSPWRRLNPGEQALLVLAHLRNGDTYTRLAAGFRVGIATVYRYVREAVDLLAADAPSLAAAMRTAQAKAFAILDGTLIPIAGSAVAKIAATTPASTSATASTSRSWPIRTAS